MIETIEHIELHEVVIPLRAPHRAAAGSLTERRVILVAVTAGGVTGWGECAPIPGYFGATIEVCWDALAATAHRVIAALGGSVPLDLPDAAGVGFEQALDDRAARTAGVPLWRHVDGHRRRVTAGAVVGLGSVADTTAAVATCVEAGYQHVKVKIAPGSAVDRLAALGSEFPGLSLAADGNGSYPFTLRDELKPLDDLVLAYLEQPFPAGDLAGHAALAGEMHTVICLDESTEVPGWREAAQQPLSGLAAAIKPARMGRQALDAMLVAPDFGSRIRLRVGGMLETGVGRAHAFAAASRDVFTLPTDLSPPGEYLAADVVAPAWSLEDGDIVLPDAPGIGVEVDRDALAAVTVRHASFP